MRRAFIPGRYSSYDKIVCDVCKELTENWRRDEMFNAILFVGTDLDVCDQCIGDFIDKQQEIWLAFIEKQKLSHNPSPSHLVPKNVSE